MACYHAWVHLTGGISGARAPGWAMVAVECSLARSHRLIELVLAGRITTIIKVFRTRPPASTPATPFRGQANAGAHTSRWVAHLHKLSQRPLYCLLSRSEQL